jgi:hypothetical protein
MSTLSRAEIGANGIARAAGGARVDLVLGPRWSSAGEGADVGCGDGELPGFERDARCRRAASTSRGKV